MKLTPAERTLLVNQHRILKILDPDERDYHELKIEMFENGYEERDDLCELEDPLTEQDKNEIYDTLNMFRSLQVSAENLEILEEFQEKHGFLFAGYDENLETGFFAFTKFIFERLGKYQDLTIQKPNYYNSHSPMRSTYQSMLAKWHDEIESTGSGNLSETQINEILEVDGD